MKKSIIIVLVLVCVSVVAFAQQPIVVKKATLLEEGTPIVNGKTGEVLRISSAPISISTLDIQLVELNPGKTAPNDTNKPVNKQLPKDRDKNQLKQEKGKN